MILTTLGYKVGYSLLEVLLPKICRKFSQIFNFEFRISEISSLFQNCWGYVTHEARVPFTNFFWLIKLLGQLINASKRHINLRALWKKCKKPKFTLIYFTKTSTKKLRCSQYWTFEILYLIRNTWKNHNLIFFLFSFETI